MDLIFNKNSNGTIEVAEIATWTSNHNYQHIEKALILAKRKVVKIVGKEIYQTALDHYLSDNYQLEITEPEEPELPEEPQPDFAKLDKLVFWFQTVLVNFAYSKNLYKDTVIWDNSGINVTWSENFRPAQEHTLQNLSESFEQDGYEFLDLLIEFLDDNADDFSEYQISVEAYKLKELFISSADDFNFFFNIKNSVSYFFEIVDVIRRVQYTTIKNALKSANYYDTLIQFITTGEVPEETPLTSEQCLHLIDLIRPVLVDLTIYSKFLSDISNLKVSGKQTDILKENIEYLRKNADAGLAQISKYIESLNPLLEQTEKYISTNNSFVM